MADLPAPNESLPLEIRWSRGFFDWLASERLSLAVSSYHRPGALLMLGRRPDGSPSVSMTLFDRAMGLWSNGQSLWLATFVALWRLENWLEPGQSQDGYDRIFVPRVGYATGDLDVHDLSVDRSGRPIFVATRFSCLASVDERYNFAPLWHPPFISALRPEDRCHLNGLALVEGQPRYVTAHSRSDTAEGWRNDNRAVSGVVLEAFTGQGIAGGLAMPHSPRWHAGRLWLLNSGTGHLGFVDLASGRFEEVAFVPGYARGLACHGRYAVIGLSKLRRERAFQGLPLDQSLAERREVPRCGLAVVDLQSGTLLHSLSIENRIEELYDVVILPGVRQPRALDLSREALGERFSFRHAGRVHHWSGSAAPVQSNQ